MSFGLVSFGHELGAPVPVADVVGSYTDDTQRILDYGYHTVYRCPPDVGLTDIAVAAGQQAMTRAGLRPAEVDLVVLAVTDMVEHLYWDASAAVAQRLGAHRAETVLLTQACTTGVVSLDVVAGKFATHPAYRTALVLAANRTCEQYWNRMDVQPMVFSDGAVGVVARRDHPAVRWLATEVRTDGTYVDFFRLDAGGAAAPFTTDRDADSLRVRDAWNIMEFFDYDSDRFEEFIRQLDVRAAETVRRACARTGTQIADIARFICLNDNTRAMASLAAELSVPLSRTNHELSMRYGHLGAADQLFCLGEYLSAGDLSSGDRVALLAMGRGMHWACSLLEI